MGDFRMEPMPWQREATRDWQERFEALGRSKGIKDNNITGGDVVSSKLMDLFLTYVGKDAYTHIKSLVAPQNPAEMKYGDLKTSIAGHLQPKTIEIAERYKFHQIRQGGRTVAVFISTLRKAAETCNFAGELDTNLRDRFVVGLEDESVVRKLLLENALTLEKAVQCASNAEEVRNLQVSMKATQYGTSSSVNAVKHQKAEIRTRGPKARAEGEGTASSCKFCGRVHALRQCPAFGKTCNKCQKKHHFAVVCKSTVNLVQQYHSDSESEYSDVLSVTGQGRLSGRCLVEATVEGHSFRPMIDTGSGPSIVPHSWVEMFPDLKGKCVPVCETLISFSGGKVPVSRRLEGVQLTVGSKQGRVNLMVADRGQALLGMDVIEQLGLVTLNVNEVRVAERVEATIEVAADAKPRFCKPRKLPYALEEPVLKELERLQQLGIVVQVESSEWATPTVVVHKPDGRVRICGDFQTTINPLIPSSVTAGLDIDDTLAKLAGCDTFSKIDVKDAYLQVPLDKASQLLTVISTPFGLYKYLCLPFGVKSAPHIFQTKMMRLLFDLETVHCHLDDVLIATKPGQDHDQLLAEVKRRLEKACLPINDKKSVYRQKEVNHLGYRIRANQIRPDSGKVKNLRDVPVPREAKELQRFVCAAGFYAKFIPKFADVVHPLRELVRAETYKWESEHGKAFECLKDALCGCVLKAFNPKEDVELICDASAVAVGAVLSQGGQPVLYISKTLSQAERNYSQLDREALAIIYAVKRLHKYVYGRKFAIVTDHKPLEYILKQDGCKSAHANQRVIRWGVFLANYDYEIVGRRTNEIPMADMLSRVEVGSDVATFDVGAVDIFFKADRNLRAAIVATFEVCKQFALLKQYVKFGWPKVIKNISVALRPYYRVHSELSFHDELLYRNGRLIVPKPLRQTILDNLHSAHLGMVKMKSLARSRYWWPEVDQDIERTCRECAACQRIKRPQTMGGERSWPESGVPFARVHVDYAGPIEGHYFLLVVDSYSNYPFVYRTEGETAAETLAKLKEVFGIVGLPRCLVSDNGPAFRAEEFRQYFIKRGVELWNSPVGHPKSNGLVERFVGNFKLHMKLTEGKGDLESRVHNFLLQYRVAGIKGGKSPAEHIFTFVPRMPVLLVKPGQPIYYQNFRKNLPSTFERGVVISTTGRTCINVHDLETDKGHTRHVDQVKPVPGESQFSVEEQTASDSRPRKEIEVAEGEGKDEDGSGTTEPFESGPAMDLTTGDTDAPMQPTERA
jgi:transposase InsO family protein